MHDHAAHIVGVHDELQVSQSVSQYVCAVCKREVVQVCRLTQCAGCIGSASLECHVSPEAVGGMAHQLGSKRGGGVSLVVDQVLVDVPEHDVRLGAPVPEERHVLVEPLPVAVAKRERYAYTVNSGRWFRQLDWTVGGGTRVNVARTGKGSSMEGTVRFLTE